MPTYTLIVRKKGEQAESAVSIDADSLDAAFLNAEAKGFQVVGQAVPGTASSPIVPPIETHRSSAHPANRSHAHAPTAGTIELGPATLKSIERAIGKQVVLALVLFCVLLPLILFAFGAIFTFLTTDPNAI